MKSKPCMLLNLFFVLAFIPALRAQVQAAAPLVPKLLGPPYSIMESSSYNQVLLDKYIQFAKENNPKAKTTQTRIDIAKNAVKIQNLNWVDMFSVTFIYAPNATYNILDPTYFDGIQLGVSLNFSTFLQKPLNVKRTKFDLQISKYDQEDYMLTLESQVKSRYVAYIQNLASLYDQSDAMDKAQANFGIQKSRFDRSEISLVEFNQAQQALVSSRGAKYAAEAGFLNAKFSLEELLTRRLEDIR